MRTMFRVSLLFFLLLLELGLLRAQEKMSKDAWQQQMTEAMNRITQLQNQMARLDSDKLGLQAQSSKLDDELRACQDALYGMLGITRADAEAFEKELSDMEKRVDELSRMSDDQLATHRDEVERLSTRLKEMSGTKMALIPRYKDRLTALQDRVDGLWKSITKEKTYTVGTWARNRDCLWNIAMKKDVYANAWMWPKIWQSNRDHIKDPDVINPKWILKIPEAGELTKQERSAANRYYRRKAAAPSGQ